MVSRNLYSAADSIDYTPDIEGSMIIQSRTQNTTAIPCATRGKLNMRRFKIPSQKLEGTSPKDLTLRRILELKTILPQISSNNNH